jgi:hypothetical protein
MGGFCFSLDKLRGEPCRLDRGLIGTGNSCGRFPIDAGVLAVTRIVLRIGTMIAVRKITKDGKVIAERTASYSDTHDGRLEVNRLSWNLVHEGEWLRFYVQGVRRPWDGEVLAYDEADGWIVLWTPKLPSRVSLLQPSLGLLTEAVEREGSMEDRPLAPCSREEAIAALEAGHIKAAGARIVGAGMGRVV